MAGRITDLRGFEYEEGDILHMRDDDGKTTPYRLLSQLGNTLSSTWLATPNTVETSEKIVLKIFNPCTSLHLRESYKLEACSLLELQDMYEYVKSGRFDLLRDRLQHPLSSLPNWTPEEDEKFRMWPDRPYRVGNVIDAALAEMDAVDSNLPGHECGKRLEKNGVMKRLTVQDRVAFVWLKARHMAAHENSIFDLLNKFPDFPCPRRLASLRVACLWELEAHEEFLRPYFEVDAIAMSYIEGFPVSRVSEAAESDKLLQQAPAELQRLIPKTPESARAFCLSLNRFLLFPEMASIGCLDFRPDNWMLVWPAEEAGPHLVWVDVGAFQPLALKCDRDAEFFPLVPETILSMGPQWIDMWMEHDLFHQIYNIARPAIVPSHEIFSFELGRYCQWEDDPEKTIAWRLVGQAFSLPYRQSGTLADPDVIVEVLRISRDLMQQELRPDDPKHRTDWVRMMTHLIELSSPLCMADGHDGTDDGHSTRFIARFQQILRRLGCDDIVRDITEQLPSVSSTPECRQVSSSVHKTEINGQNELRDGGPRLCERIKSSGWGSR